MAGSADVIDAGAPGFDLVETMRFDPVDGLALLERHLARMTRSAQALGFAFDRHGARNALQAATFRLDGPACVRLLLAQGGAIAIESRPLVPRPAPVTVAIVPLPSAAHDPRLHHRTTAGVPREADTDELLFAADGLIVGGSIAPFVPRGDRLLTPLAAIGVLRAELLANGRAIAAELRVADLADGFLVGDALHGLRAAALASTKNVPAGARVPL